MEQGVPLSPKGRVCPCITVHHSLNEYVRALQHALHQVVAADPSLLLEATQTVANKELRGTVPLRNVHKTS